MADDAEAFLAKFEGNLRELETKVSAALAAVVAARRVCNASAQGLSDGAAADLERRKAENLKSFKSMDAELGEARKQIRGALATVEAERGRRAGR
jgi:hypothetical protein